MDKFKVEPLAEMLLLELEEKYTSNDDIVPKGIIKLIMLVRELFEPEYINGVSDAYKPVKYLIENHRKRLESIGAIENEEI